MKRFQPIQWAGISHMHFYQQEKVVGPWWFLKKRKCWKKKTVNVMSFYKSVSSSLHLFCSAEALSWFLVEEYSFISIQLLKFGYHVSVLILTCLWQFALILAITMIIFLSFGNWLTIFLFLVRMWNIWGNLRIHVISHCKLYHLFTMLPSGKIYFCTTDFGQAMPLALANGTVVRSGSTGRPNL